jgi:hypothetical protein
MRLKSDVPKLGILSLSALLSFVGQLGLMYGSDSALGNCFWLGVPGFFTAMLVGLDGEPGTTSLTRPFEFFANLLFYCLLLSPLLLMYNKLQRLKEERKPR